MEDKDHRKKMYIIAGVGFALISALGLAVAFFLGVFDSEDSGLKKDKNAWYNVPFDPSMIPTNAQLDEILSRAEDDMYPKGYWDKVTPENPRSSIPGTKITFDAFDMFDSTTTVAFTVMALQSNPYALTKEHPTAFQKAVGAPDGSVRELPDGTPIDLADLEEDYTNIQTSADRDNPTHIILTGYRNQQWFEAEVNLSYLYQQYYEHPNGN